MVELIIKETDLDPYAEQTTKELGALGLFDLSRICFFAQILFHSFTHLLTIILVSGIGVHKGAYGLERRSGRGDLLVSKASRN